MSLRINYEMNKHEIKNCPRCGSQFECKPGNITQCQCFTIPLTLNEQAYIKEMYEDCLCVDCLKELKRLSREKEILNYYSKLKNVE